ncbi:uncharacterized protein LOC121719447 [Alosa sapidissima]|uniref:uncharacterized protein LOC121719447 n=1 Tax=Alosa sapidissima TaxID=34773 RepID=UPI001C0910D0|nr:uncharacterized protein LOC121719447 [Alosa sapidissima]
MECIGRLCISLFILSGGVKTFEVIGHEGSAVIIRCTYDLLYQNNSKYLCKGPLTSCSSNIKVDSKTSPAQNGRFSLYDNSSEGNFMVLITPLTTEDSGDYRCVVENAPPNTTTHIQLDVQKALRAVNPKAMTGLHGGSTEVTCPGYQHKSIYFCHHQREFTCYKLTSIAPNNTKIKVVSPGTNEGKYSVNLHQLTERDAGDYWCGAGTNGSYSFITLTKKTHLSIETQLSGYEGGEVQIICPYHPEDSEKIKFLCKDKCNKNNRPLIKSRKNSHTAIHGRFSLHDNTTAGVFTVTITGLKLEDSGKYWCGTNRTSVSIFDYYTTLQVTPKPAPLKTPPPPSSSSSSSPSSSFTTSSRPSAIPASPPPPPPPPPQTSPPSRSDSVSTASSSPGAVVVVCVVLTAAALLLLIIVCMQRRKRTRERLNAADGETAGNTQVPLTDRTYEEIKDPRAPQPTEATDTNPNTVYVMAQLPTIPSDDPTYSTAQLPTIPSADPTYSTAQLPTILSDGPTGSTAELPTILSADPTNPCDDGTYSLAKLPTSPSDDNAYSFAQTPIITHYDDGTYSFAKLPTNPSDEGTYSLAKLPTSPCDDPTYCTAELPISSCDDGNYSLVQPPTDSSENPLNCTTALSPNLTAELLNNP